jgi:hypothetical protein
MPNTTEVKSINVIELIVDKLIKVKHNVAIKIIAVFYNVLIMFGFQKVNINLNIVRKPLYIETDIAATYFEPRFCITMNEGSQLR